MKNIYIAVADNLSRQRAYEFAKENGFEIVGQSGYIDDASADITDGNIDAVICSHRLFDGEAKSLYNQLPNHIKNKCEFLVISPVKNGTYKLKKMSFATLRQKDIRVETALNYVSIPKSLKGYQFFKDALDIVMSTPDALLDMTHKIYAVIAKTYNTDISSVEYNMRTAKNHSLLHCNPDVIVEIFGELPDEELPPVSVYISKLSDYILKTR